MERHSYATVLANGHETRYVRAGSGPTVVVLRAVAPHTDPGLDTFLGSAGQFKLIVPELPALILESQPDVRTATCRLCGVLDGLGIAEAFLVADSRLSWLAAALLAEDAERIRGTATLTEGCADAMRNALASLSPPPVQA